MTGPGAKDQFRSRKKVASQGMGRAPRRPFEWAGQHRPYFSTAAPACATCPSSLAFRTRSISRKDIHRVTRRDRA